jgi:hypothetical protein
MAMEAICRAAVIGRADRNTGTGGQQSGADALVCIITPDAAEGFASV